MKKENNIIQWLRDHDLINARKLERISEIRQGAISAVLSGDRSFTEDHEKKLRRVLKDYGLK